MNESTFAKGLEGVVAAESEICQIDGTAGKLYYRGISIDDLAEHSSFEETTYLLLYERLPKKDELDSFRQQLAGQREIPDGIVDALKTCPHDALPMDILQSAVPMLDQYDKDVRDPSIESVNRMALRLIAKFATVMAAWNRIRNGQSSSRCVPAAKLRHSRRHRCPCLRHPLLRPWSCSR